MLRVERSILVSKITRKLHTNFPLMREVSDYEGIKIFVDRWIDNIFLVCNNKEIRGLAVYIMVSDLALEAIKHGIYDLKNPEEFDEVRQMKGDNMHVFCLVAEGTRVILKGLKDIIKLNKPKTVSWITPDMSRFVIVKGGK